MPDPREIFKSHKTVVFDFDGVVTNSNSIKSKAFFEIGSYFSLSLANRLVELNELNPGVSRYEKFAEFLTWLPIGWETKADVKTLSLEFSKITLEMLADVEWDTKLLSLREENETQDWLIISGADEQDLHTTCKRLGVFDLFNGGVYGSPKTKIELFGLLNVNRALVIGDGPLDKYCADMTECDFIFVSHWATKQSLEELTVTAKHQVASLAELTDAFTSGK